MDERPSNKSELYRRIEALSDLAGRMEAAAARLGGLAGDCRLWGLGDDGDEARRHAVGLRVAALMNRGHAAGIEARLAGPRSSV